VSSGLFSDGNVTIAATTENAESLFSEEPFNVNQGANEGIIFG